MLGLDQFEVFRRALAKPVQLSDRFAPCTPNGLMAGVDNIYAPGRVSVACSLKRLVHSA
jgi:hypothetical protein